jgi:hypothetical protein
MVTNARDNMQLKHGHQNRKNDLGPEILTAMAMDSSIFWGIKTSNPLKVNRRFGGTCIFQLQCRRTNQVGK